MEDDGDRQMGMGRNRSWSYAAGVLGRTRYRSAVGESPDGLAESARRGSRGQALGPATDGTPCCGAPGSLESNPAGREGAACLAGTRRSIVVSGASGGRHSGHGRGGYSRTAPDSRPDRCLREQGHPPTAALLCRAYDCPFRRHPGQCKRCHRRRFSACREDFPEHGASTATGRRSRSRDR